MVGIHSDGIVPKKDKLYSHTLRTQVQLIHKGMPEYELYMHLPVFTVVEKWRKQGRTDEGCSKWTNFILAMSMEKKLANNSILEVGRVTDCG